MEKFLEENRLLFQNASWEASAAATHADGYGERLAALAMLDTLPGAHRKTLAADKGYDTRDFIADCRKRGATPNVASQTTR